MEAVMTILTDTPRLILRTFEDQDIIPLSIYRSDPEAARYQGWSAPYSVEQAADLVHEMKTITPGEPGRWLQIAIELKWSGELIGDCVFHRLADNPAQAEIGYTISRPFQKQGYGAEAVNSLLEYLFLDLGLHRVRANCDPQNLPSIKLLNKLGMRHEGRSIQSLYLKGEWVDEDWYAILKEEWRNKRR
jgi:RimJ/RimL family protein N-acetyltransferase